jgi:hypothetical protein
MHAKSFWERAKPIIDVLSGVSVIATMIFIAYQSYEMKEGAGDTHELAVAAGTQADAAGKQADAAGKQEADTHDLAVAAAKQSDNTAKLADAAAKQAGAAQDQVRKLQAGVEETGKLAAAAAGANIIAARAMEVQTRPWVGISEFKLTKQTVDANATNFGKTWELVASLANYGNSPARRILISMEAIQETTQYVDKVGEKTWKDVRSCVDMESDSLAPPKGLSTMIIFPQQSGIPADPQDVSIGNTINRVERTPEIVVCIVYLGTGNDIHHTKLLYKPIRSPESVPVPNFPSRRYFPVIRYEISDTEAD